MVCASANATSFGSLILLQAVLPLIYTQHFCIPVGWGQPGTCINPDIKTGLLLALVQMPRVVEGQEPACSADSQNKSCDPGDGPEGLIHQEWRLWWFILQPCPSRICSIQPATEENPDAHT